MSEMSWTKKNGPSRQKKKKMIVSTSQEVEVMVARESDTAPSVACRWASSRPCATPGRSSKRPTPSARRSRARVKKHHRVRPVHRPAGRYRRMVHLSDLTWEGRGEDVIGRVIARVTWSRPWVTEVDTDKERISLVDQRRSKATPSPRRSAA